MHLRRFISRLCRYSTVWLVAMALLCRNEALGAESTNNAGDNKNTKSGVDQSVTSTSTPAALELGPLNIAAGPWMQIDERGLITIAVRLVPPIDLAALQLVQPYIGRAQVPAPQSTRVIPAAGGLLAGQIVVRWILPPLTSGHVRLGTHARAPAVEVPVVPAPTDAIALAVVGGARWPTAEVLLPSASAATARPISVVLLLGSAPYARIGTAGWESRIPLLCRLAPPPPGEIADAVQLAVVGPAESRGVDVTWGCLGLPSLVNGANIAVDMAGRTRAWNVLLDPLASWDLSLRAPRAHRDVANLRIAVGLAHVLNIPCILGGGSPTGFVSEPMITAQVGGLQVASGGVRYVAATPAGDGVRSLDRFTAMALVEPALTIIEATSDELVLRLAEKAPAALLQWKHVANAPETGSGRADGLALAESWREAMAKRSEVKKAASATTPAAQAIDPHPVDLLLTWLPRSTLARAEWSILELFIFAGSQSAADRAFAKRLVADPWFVGDEEVLLRRLPDWLQRDALLRWMAEPDAPAHAWIRVAGTTSDTQVVRALLSNIEQGGSQVLLEVLVERLTAQAAGRIPVDEDPMLQSRLATAVFDSPTLSPTPLRPIARELEKKLSPLAQKPVARFLERVGRFRPVP